MMTYCRRVASAVAALAVLAGSPAHAVPPAATWLHVVEPEGRVPGYPQWRPALWGAVSAPLGEQAVQAAVAADIAYCADRGGDHWQTPAETLARGCGDCEDIAILKYVALRSQGIHALLALGKLSDGTGHAVVMTDDGAVLNDGVKETMTVIVALDDTGAWIPPVSPGQ